MKEQIDFTEQVAVVTGAASGIGEGIATEFAKEGASIAVANIAVDRGTAVADRIAVDHDVSSSEDPTESSVPAETGRCWTGDSTR